MSILANDWSNCLTCGSPKTNVHPIHHSVSSLPTNRAKHFSCTKNSSIFFPWVKLSHCKLLKSIEHFIMYVLIRAYLICSASDFCSLVSCWYTVRTPASSRNGSTLFISHNSHINATFSIHSTIGRSVAAPLNSEISHVSNPLSTIFVDRNAKIA